MNNSLSTKGKVIFGILFTLFFIPETIWGTLRSQWHNLYTGYISHTGGYIDLWSSGGFYATILFLQLISALLFLTWAIWKRKKIVNKTFFWVIVAGSAVAVVYSFVAWLMVYAMLNVTITSGLP